MSVKHYRELIAWQKAMDLTTECYRITTHFPKSETYGLTASIQRTATAIPSEIAQGQGRSTTRDFLWHLGNANGRCSELETQIILAFRVGHLPEEEMKQILERSAEVGRIISGLISSLERRLDSSLATDH